MVILLIVLALIAFILAAGIWFGQWPVIGLRLGVLSVLTMLAWGGGRIATSLPLAPFLLLLGALGISTGAVAVAWWVMAPLRWGLDDYLMALDGLTTDEEGEPQP